MTPTRMTPDVARMALRQFGLTEVLGLLAYVEGFGLVVGSLGVVVEPTRLVRDACAEVIDGRAPWAPPQDTLPAHLRTVLRTCLSERLRREALTRGQDGRPVRDLRMAVAQLGDLAGVAELAHGAGELMVFVRSGDADMLRAAIAVCDRTRARLEEIAAMDGGADTAPIVALPPRLASPPEPGVVAAVVADDGPSTAAHPRGVRDTPTPRSRRPAHKPAVPDAHTDHDNTPGRTR